MKIPGSVRNAYADQTERYGRLKEAIDRAESSFSKPRWHYESRVKGLLSYALKLETGRGNPYALEDFFACTVVVANLAEVREAEALVCQKFDLKERRPPRSDQTHKRPEEFTFDDLRLYVAIRPDPALPPSDLSGLVFEFQIKTFLQHAWSIATHDLIYKTDDVKWSKQRIAFQVKAMLEHAEVSIQGAETLADTAGLGMESAAIIGLRRTLEVLRQQWPNEGLPNDLKRLSENVWNLTKALSMAPDQLVELLNAGKAASGAHPSNLSPFGTIVQYLVSSGNAAFISYVQKPKGTRGSPAVLMPAEIALPEGVDRSTWTNIVVV